MLAHGELYFSARHLFLTPFHLILDDVRIFRTDRTQEAQAEFHIRYHQHYDDPVYSGAFFVWRFYGE